MHVSITGGKFRRVQVMEQFKDQKTGKYRSRVIKDYGKLDELVALDPNFVEKLRAECREESKKEKELRKVTIQIDNCMLNSAGDAAQCFRFGHAAILKLFTDMGLEDFFDGKVDKKNKKVVMDIIRYLILRRCSAPDSIRAAQENMKEYAGLKSHKLDAFYPVLDVLAELKQETIDHFSEFMMKKTNRKMDTVCYDVTNYYFESQKVGELRLFGFSKEHKNNEVIVVMGLLIDSNGIPITYRLFPGNTMDQKTLAESTAELLELYGMDSITMVADRGMNSSENLCVLHDRNCNFVISYTLKKASKKIMDAALCGEWEAVFYDSEGNMTYATKKLPFKVKHKVLMTESEQEDIKAQRKESHSRGRCPIYKEVEVDCNIHVSWSRDRDNKDKHDRERFLEKLEKNFNNNKGQMMKRGQMKYIRTGADPSKFEIDWDLIAEESKFDGYYAVVTDKEMESDEAMSIYRSQWKIEESFRILKTDLEARPVFVWTDGHIEGYFLICYIALTMLRYLQYLLVKNGLELSAERIMNAFHSPEVAMVGNKDNPYLMPVHITEDYLRIAKTLKMKPLYRVMEPTIFKRQTGLDIEVNLK